MRMSFVDKNVTRPGFMDELLADFRASTPFLSFVCKAIGLPFWRLRCGTWWQGIPHATP